MSVGDSGIADDLKRRARCRRQWAGDGGEDGVVDEEKGGDLRASNGREKTNWFLMSLPF